jgi:hypothetical protein
MSVNEKQWQENEFIESLDLHVNYDNEGDLRRGFSAGWNAAMEAVMAQVRKAA